VPKKVGRGQKYTTGIKKTSSGGYGGQHTSRRPFCGLIIYVPLGIAVALGISEVAQHL
jgi:hypothetical protein